MFHRAEPFVPAPGRGALWNRGAYLVEGLGHCSACHSPRNALGAELDGAGHLAGGEVEGWYAPPLNGVSPAPIAWTEQAYFDYLRTGHSAEHGAAGGPMAPIVAELGGAPDEDIRAMAHYLASLAPPAPAADSSAKGPAGRGGEGARLRSGASLRRPNLFRRLRGLPRARTGRADVRREAVAGAEHRSSRRCARHGAARHPRRLSGAAWPRTAWRDAGLRALSRRCSARRSRGLSAAPASRPAGRRGADLRSARRISGDRS